MTAGRRRASLAVVVLALIGLVGTACGGSQAATLVTYQRTWPDGFHEELTVLDDGRVTMHHGDTLERLTLTSDQVRMLRDALAAGVPSGDQGDTLVRTVILGNGTVQTPVRPVPGSSVEMLEVLMTTHSLGGVEAQGVTPPPLRTHGHMPGAAASPAS